MSHDITAEELATSTDPVIAHMRTARATQPHSVGTPLVSPVRRCHGVTQFRYDASHNNAGAHSLRCSCGDTVFVSDVELGDMALDRDNL